MRIHFLSTAALCAVISMTATECSKQAEAKTWSPHKVAGLLQSKHFKIDDVRRKGTTYVVIADGPKGNRVQFVVDGKAGKVLGMDVIKWAPGAKRVKRGSHGDDVFDEFYEFGVTVSAATYSTWTDYSETQWTSSSDEYIELTSEESSEEVTTEEVSYEESVQEVTEDNAEQETVESSESTSTEENTSSDESSSNESNESSSEQTESHDSDSSEENNSSGGGDSDGDPH